MESRNDSHQSSRSQEVTNLGSDPKKNKNEKCLGEQEQAQMDDAHVNVVNLGNPNFNRHSELSLSVSAATSTAEMRKKTTVTVAEVVEELKRKNESARRLLRLHRINKKHTILFWCLIVVNIIWTILITLVSSWMWLEVTYNILVNIVCVWLMFGISRRYWKFATKWCCCYVCYCNKKRQIGVSYLLCFC